MPGLRRAHATHGAQTCALSLRSFPIPCAARSSRRAALLVKAHIPRQRSRSLGLRRESASARPGSGLDTPCEMPHDTHVRLEHLTCWTWRAASFGEDAAFLLSASISAVLLLRHRRLPKGSARSSLANVSGSHQEKPLPLTNFRLSSREPLRQSTCRLAEKPGQPAISAAERKVIPMEIVSRPTSCLDALHESPS